MRYLRVPGLVLLAAGLAVTGWLLMSTNFMIHDDEGYVLLSLKNFSEHGRLYDEVFTQYGPAPFLYYDSLHRLLDWPITNLFGRTLTLLHWVAAALAASLVAWRLSQRYWTALFTLLIVFMHLRQMIWEPTHPGGLISMITAVTLAGAAEALWRGRTVIAALIFGSAGALLFFTKINIGLLWTCSVGALLLLGTTGPVLRGRGAWLAATGMALLPMILMHPLLGEPWVLGLAVMFAVAGAAVCALLAVETMPPFGFRVWAAGFAGFAGWGAVIIGATLAHGTSPGGLLHGVVLDPLHHPVNFHFGFVWHPMAWVTLGAAVIVTGLWCARPALRVYLVDVVAGLRLLVLGCFVWYAPTWLHVYGVGSIIIHVLPLTPLFLLPLSPPTAGDRRRPIAGLVALVGVGQVLHTYPVAGSQMAWGTFLLLPLFVHGLAEAAGHLARRLHCPWLEAVMAVVALGTAGWQTNLFVQRGWSQWIHSEPLGLPDAESLRPPESLRYALRILTANAGLHADLLYSRPGMFSFNLWTGLPTPTMRNATHWFWLLNPAEQQAIIDRLQAEPRSVIISSQPLIELLDRQIHMTITGPLNEFIGEHYRTLFTVTGYDFMVPQGSAAAPFFVARNFQRAARAIDTEPAMITVNVAAKAMVTRIILRDVRYPGRVLAQWQADNSRVTLTAINAAGQPAGAPQPCSWPLQIDGLRQLQLYHSLVISRDRAELQLLFLDAEGQSLFEACYQEPVSVSVPPAGG